MVSPDADGQTPLHDDLVEMLSATRDAEHELYAPLPPDVRDAPARIGEWSAKDVLAHLAAWRSIEARRLASGMATAEGTDAVSMPGDGTPVEAAPDDGDPGLDDPVDEEDRPAVGDQRLDLAGRVDRRQPSRRDRGGMLSGGIGHT